MILRRLEPRDEIDALRAHQQFAAEDWEFLLEYEQPVSWADYLELLANRENGIDLPDNRVPATFLIAESDGALVGRSSIRHKLNDYLFNFGGHIGYGVLSEYRNRGFGKEILRQSLQIIRRLGVEDVLVTCGDENVGSYKIIESQGAILENKVDNDGRLTRRYWIKGS